MIHTNIVDIKQTTSFPFEINATTVDTLRKGCSRARPPATSIITCCKGRFFLEFRAAPLLSSPHCANSHGKKVGGGGGGKDRGRAKSEREIESHFVKGVPLK